MKIGVIGGSGLYQLSDLTGAEWVTVHTPFGVPSDQYLRGSAGEHTVFFLPRHGRGHRILPSEINYRANIFGFKMLGVERIISVTAVGSLREDIRPRDILIPDQYFDRSKGSANQTFFGGGIAAHISFAEPVCPTLATRLYDLAHGLVTGDERFAGRTAHRGGTYVNMEGPAFSTKAESNFYRQAGFHVIGMTSLAEAKLAREAEICYAPLAMITDYDCWHEEEAPVTADMVMANVKANADLASEILRAVYAAALNEPRTCPCAKALQGALMTAPEHICGHLKVSLKPLIGKYLQ